MANCPLTASILSAGGHALVVGKLLSLGSPVEQCDSRSRTALHWAAEQGHADAAGVLVAAMLDAGVDVHLQARPDMLRSATQACCISQVAAGFSHCLTFSLLLSSCTCAITACSNSQPPDTQWAHPQGRAVGPILQANTDHAAVPYCTQSLAGNILLSLDCLDAGTKQPALPGLQDADGLTAAQLAADNGNHDVVAKILDSARNKDEKGYTALHLATQHCMTDLVRLLLQTPGCEVSPRDVDGLTPLHWAASKGAAAAWPPPAPLYLNRLVLSVQGHMHSGCCVLWHSCAWPVACSLPGGWLTEGWSCLMLAALRGALGCKGYRLAVSWGPLCCVAYKDAYMIQVVSHLCCKASNDITPPCRPARDH